MAKVFLTVSGTSVPRVSLNELLDVDTSGGADGYVLTQQADGSFALEQVAQSLDDLSDVTLTTPTTGDYLYYNGADWINQSLIVGRNGAEYTGNYDSEAETLLDGATATVELYYTAQADGDGLHEDAQTDTPRSGFDIQRKLYYAEKAQADPDTAADWTQFTAIADNTTYANAKAALLAYLKERTGGTVPISLKMTWEEVAQAPSFTGLLNESYGSGAEAAYSTRRLNGNVTECMVIRRASDSTTTTIGFDGSGNIDESAIETFCTGTTCTVVTWKDQSGNGNDATAPSTTEEPTIYTGGALVKDNGRAAIDFSAGVFYLDATISNQTQPYSFYNVFQWNVTTYAHRFVTTGNDNFSRVRGFSTNPNYISAGTILGFNQDNWATAQQVQETLIADGANSIARGSGTQVATGNAGTNSTGTTLKIGARANNSQDFDGYAQELVYYPANKSTGDRTSIEENQGDYFTQNTPLLDTYSGAAAAYSLRLLDSTYTGALINVWNGTSYADIYPNVFGELDTVALAAHCGSNDGFIRYWYDQSGNSNTAAQTTTANMPKIYDGTTGVVTENGKPAVQAVTGGDFLSVTGAIDTTSRTIYQFSVYGINSTGGNNTRIKTGQLEEGEHNFSEKPKSFTIRTSTISGTAVDALQAGNMYLRHSYADTVNLKTFLNGSSTAIIDIADNNEDWASSDFSIFSNTSGAGTMYVSELIIYQSDQSSNRTNIEDNINTFYNIY